MTFESLQLAPQYTVVVNVSSLPAKHGMRTAGSRASMSASVGTDGQSIAAGSIHGVPSLAAVETQPSGVTRFATVRMRYHVVYPEPDTGPLITYTRWPVSRSGVNL